MRRIVPRLLIAASLCSALLLVSRTAAAHRLNVFAYVEGGDVVVETYFGDGKGARGAAIEAYDAAGTLVASGKTADDGTFRFAVPASVGALRVVASTGEGHRGEYEMTAEELRGAAVAVEVSNEGAAAADGAGTASGTQSTNDPNLDEVLKRLNRIEAQVLSVQRQVNLLRRPKAGPSFERVMMGLGFIIGLTGAAMFGAVAYKTRAAARFQGGSTTHTG